jgi:hypothetical protein
MEDGTVISRYRCQAGKILTGSYNNGRLQYSLKTGKILYGFIEEAKWFYADRLVAEYYVENKNPRDNTEIRHLDGDKQNCDYTNLEWIPKTPLQQLRSLRKFL